MRPNGVFFPGGVLERARLRVPVTVATRPDPARPDPTGHFDPCVCIGNFHGRFGAVGVGRSGQGSSPSCRPRAHGHELSAPYSGKYKEAEGTGRTSDVNDEEHGGTSKEINRNAQEGSRN